MSEQPIDRATRRIAAAWNIGWKQARYAVEHTTTGQLVLLNEQGRELGRVIARTAPGDLRRVAGWLRRLRSNHD